jgi:hypothetical protein
MDGLAAFRESSALDQVMDESAELLREARAKTLSSENATVYGVHFGAQDLTLFAGGVYMAGDPKNEVITLPPTVRTSAVSLSTTTSSIIFDRLTGETQATGTVSFTTTRSGKIKQIQVLPSGLFLKL